MLRIIEKKWSIPKHEVNEFFKRNSRYCICIPVINEGQKIKKQLKKMLIFSKIADIIIIDKGSNDGSTNPNFLKKMNVRTLITLKELGYQGTQLRAGFAYALKQGYEMILQVDGNNKDNTRAIPNFIQAFEEGFHYIQGSRFIRGGKAINTPFFRWVGLKLIASPILSWSAGYWYTDVTNGFRGYSRQYLLHPKVNIFRDIFNKYEFNLYLTVRANQLGLKTKEIPVIRKYPKGKVPTKISMLSGNVNFLKSIFKIAFGYYHPRE